jgi:quercetin dioxygenase-like cupin family protein
MKQSSQLVIGAFVALGAAAAIAQQAGFTRTPLQDQPLSDPARHAVQARAEFAPGIAAGKHTHPGEELGYVLEGEVLLEIEGQPPRTVKAGEAFFVPAGLVHDCKNTSSGVTKVLATYIVEKGKPVATPVK